MGRGVMGQYGAVTPTANHLPVFDDDGAHRHLAISCSGLSLLKRHPHKGLVHSRIKIHSYSHLRNNDFTSIDQCLGSTNSLRSPEA